MENNNFDYIDNIEIYTKYIQYKLKQYFNMMSTVNVSQMDIKVIELDKLHCVTDTHQYSMHWCLQILKIKFSTIDNLQKFILNVWNIY